MSTMVIFACTDLLFDAQLTTAVQLNIFMETFFPGFFEESKFQKNRKYKFCVFTVSFNASCLIKV